MLNPLQWRQIWFQGKSLELGRWVKPAYSLQVGRLNGIGTTGAALEWFEATQHTLF